MSRDYPCIYFEKDGVCRKLTDDTVIGYCVMGPCPYQKASNSDKFRAMSDEELAEWLCQALDCDFCKAHMQNIPTYSYCENHESGILKWLQQPAEEEP